MNTWTRRLSTATTICAALAIPFGLALDAAEPTVSGFQPVLQLGGALILAILVLLAIGTAASLFLRW